MMNNETDYAEELKQVVITKEFADNVNTWVNCDNEIRELNKRLKQLKKSRKTSEKFVEDYMRRVNLPIIRTTDSNIRRVETETKSGLKKDLLKNALTELTKNEQQANKMTDFILSKREIKKRVYLKRTKLRKKNN